MANPSPFLRLPNRDGASQNGRYLTALDPSYVSVDERSLKDLAAFARAYAAELKYFDPENNKEANWSSFFGAIDLNKVVAFMEAPEKFNSTDYDLYRRPHFCLLLTFLKLLRHAQADLNRFTRRHLEFYYQEVLRLAPKKGLPDRVHVVVELVEGQRQFFLPSGTLLHAGSDSQESDLFYRTDRDLLASQAQVASLKTLFVAKKVINVREVHREGIEKKEPTSETFLAMIKLALGDPNLGDRLPPYPPPYDRTPDEPLFKELDSLLDFIQDKLFLSLPAFRELMQLKRKVDPPGTHDPRWVDVNKILEQAGKQRVSNFRLDASKPENFEPENFDRNLKAAAGLLEPPGELKTLFVGLPGVITIYDLNRQYLHPRSNIDPEVLKRIIVEKLRIDLGEFKTLMETVEDIYQDWRRVYDILRAAGREKDRKLATHQLVPMISDYLRAYVPGKFQKLVKDTLGDFTFPELSGAASLDDCYTRVLTLEHYFYISAEDFCFIRKIVAIRDGADIDLGAEDYNTDVRFSGKPSIARVQDDQVYGILEQAHKEKVYTKGRLDLKQKHISAGFTVAGFEALVKFALGHPAPGNDLPEGKDFLKLHIVNDEKYIRTELFLEPANFEYIKKVAQETKPDDEEWENVYIMLERAQRRKRGWKEPSASVEKWQNIYAAPNATQVESGKAKDPVTPRWRTFGGTKKENSGNLGFAVSSPLLALAEGARTIILKLQFRSNEFKSDQIRAALEPEKELAFRFLVSAAGKMVEIEKSKAKINVDDANLTVTLNLDDQVPSMAPLSTGPAWPVLQMLLKDIVEKGGTVTKLYPLF